MSMPSYLDAARATLALGLVARGATSVASGDFLPQLQPVGDVGAARWALATAHGAVVIVLALLLFGQRTRDGARLTMSVLLLAWFALALMPAWLAKPSSVTARVSALETLALAAVVWAAWTSEPRSRTSAIGARWIFGAMLLAFGAVHLGHHEAIAGMIPTWLPARATWPWVTGGALVAAGLALLAGRWAREAALATAAMFGSWLPLVHLGRLIERPGNAFELTFASMALALTGAAWCVAALVGTRATASAASADSTQGVAAR
jgi:hypothetical protein